MMCVKPNRLVKLLLPALLVFIGIAGCGTHRVRDKNPPEASRVWPAEPETARIRFDGVVTRPSDLNIRPGIFTRFYRYIGGMTTGAIGKPCAVTTDGHGKIYVVDAALKSIHVFDAGANAYHRFFAGNPVFVSPVDIAVADNGDRIYVTDSKKGVVFIFRNQGKTFEGVFGADLFKRPTGIAVNPVTNELVVVDTLQSCVLRFNLADLTFLGKFGQRGRDDGEFHYPTHIAVTPSGGLVVTDALNFQVQVFSPEGIYANRFGTMGRTPGTFSRPKGVAVDSEGNIYVVDALFDNIQMFDPDGRLLMAFGAHGTAEGQFWLPSGIFIDENDAVFVADAGNNRIQMFQYLK